MALIAGDTAVTEVDVEKWLEDLRDRSRTAALRFVRDRCAELFTGRTEGGLAVTALPSYVAGGKFLRSAFAQVGWCCGRRTDSEAASLAGASLELLHCFALAQDDVMDNSPLRRGTPALHTQFTRWHHQQGWAGSPVRFGESAAVLSGDLFLVWSEQLLRESGLGTDELARGWPVYDVMRAELAVGQLGDLVNDARQAPNWASVLDVLRRKSGNYTVRRPLEFGAALAGCAPGVLARLGTFGTHIGEAFQFRDDLLGVYGDPAITGKPVGDDLREHKATSVVVLARELGSPRQRKELAELDRLDPIGDDAVHRWQTVIEATGAREHLEGLITARVTSAHEILDHMVIPPRPRRALSLLALRCTARSH
ncbi:polyprenyl synthetase family protein [Amycolatopsis sp. QT-25]|uniref:polyprenyl synthetase family protein n=1 Tax=Amycolatopsis sp. QT-25 TaxID=3034022 RepID=UPI0023EC3506|nr:polyprenyl synthetase family protein [Amycolatopsis sp. QT-25]WET76820.1 polyprenyl synthetase family protein [Amycolatopsis sp. QT-25]